MTGLDLEVDQIIEIAVIITDKNLEHEILVSDTTLYLFIIKLFLMSADITSRISIGVMLYILLANEKALIIA